MYLTEQYLRELFGSNEVSALCPTPAELTRVIEAAEAETETALQNGGYRSAVPSSVYSTLEACPKAIRLLAYGAWIELAHGRKRVEIPAQFLEYVRKLDLVRTGKYEIPGVEKDVARAVGGILSSDTSPTSSTSRQQVFGRGSFRDGGY
ncbi:hypothetical protein [Sandaracinus amylolyticus]|uniref:hypothetical protein n=1 Tax=Sandaracinus amylolyticus TaxID=927083 RepID=UPI001F48547B|nr:hypothetical protein [Sandaracinus amylolyticus]UJR81486.1 Hypothetical protein I5071_35460 [Sandaracinus amylolyticus]